MNTQTVSVGLDGPMVLCVKCGRPSHLAAVRGDCLACSMNWTEEEDGRMAKAEAAKTVRTVRKRSAVAFEKKLDEMIGDAEKEAEACLKEIDEAARRHGLAVAKVETLKATQVALAATADADPD